MSGNHREKNPKNFRPEYYFHVSSSSGVFLSKPVIIPPLSSRLWPFPDPEIIDLGE
jgi:hypothetical protein